MVRRLDQMKFKVLVVGGQKCGKSSLAERLTDGEFSAVYKQTLGFDVLQKVVTAAEGERVALELWSCGGAERLRPLLKRQYPRTQCALLVYDCSESESMGSMQYWRDEMNQHCPDAKLVLVGTKSDINSAKAIPHDVAADRASSWKIEHVVVSAANGDGLEELSTLLSESLRSTFDGN